MAKPKKAKPIFSERFEEAMKLAGHDEFYVAYVLSCSKRDVNAYINGLRRPEPERVGIFAEECGVTLDWLDGRTDDPYVTNLHKKK